ncbi:hypothetical protein [Shinella zoogloeoides]|uniref:hypothetical protein n=1 Tax=Shinella zoogloeoides TaxID=352475 RepID=UPI000E6530A3|nr:hypothetical protein [Shinella zoogloeoides]
MQPAVYFHTDAYLHAIDTVENVARSFDPAEPADLRTRIMEALGDLGIWPMEIFNGQDEGEVIVAV